MANYLRRRLANVVLASDKNHFLDDNTFLKIPRVQTINEANQDIDSGDFDLMRRKDIKDVRDKIIQNTENINNSFSVIGPKSGEQFLEDLQQDLLTSTALGDAWATVSQFVAPTKTRMTMQEAFAVMAKSINALSPLGEIKPFWGMKPLSLAKWEAVDNANEAGAFNIGGTFLQKGYLLKEWQERADTEGFPPAQFYRLAGGNWALCDGNFPLPPHLHGSSRTSVSAWIPDLRETYLKGAGEWKNELYTQDDIEAKVAEEKAYLTLTIDTMEDGAEKTKLIEERDSIDYLSFSYLLNQPKFVGKNTFKLNVDQLPQHKHAMEHTHDGTAKGNGEHSHRYTDRYGTGAGGHGARERERSNVEASQTLDTTSNGEHTHDIETDKTFDMEGGIRKETDAMGKHADIDKCPQSLQVAYYMRVR